MPGCFQNLKMYLILTSFCFIHIISAAPLINVMVDMTHTYDQNTINHPAWRKFEMKIVKYGIFDNHWLQGEDIITATHMGTHMDAPSHFTRGGLNIDQIDIHKLFVPAAVINIENRAAQDPVAVVTVDDLQKWERMTGQSLNGMIVLMNSGWGKKWYSRKEYLGTEENDSSKMRFPGFSREAAQWLVDNRNIVGIGVDTISLDKGGASNSPVHNIILPKGLFGIECIANMEQIPIYGAILYIMPMKIAGASGSPTRIIASFPQYIF